MEVLQNPSDGSLLTDWFIILKLTNGISPDFQRLFIGREEKKRKEEALPNSIYPQELLTPENFLKKVYNLT